MENKIKLNLSQIGLYNPQRLNDEAVEMLFIVRAKVLQQLLSKINKEKPGSIPQHYLIIGQRGMGKTTLLKRIEVELRKPEYSGKFVPLLFPEEQYNLKNLAELWLNCLDALADTLETEKNTQEVQKIDKKVKELSLVNNENEIAGEAYDFLKLYSKSTGRRAVLLIDNMSLIFDRLSKEEQHTLRSLLMQKNAPILVGASAVSIEGTFDYGAPFYDAFQIHNLYKLSFEELVDILINLAKLTQEEEILPEINNRISRLKTLHQLTGGNPRTATMLFRVIIKGFSNDITDDLEALLDEITPLYKARFEELSTQMQIIVDAVALNWDPITLEQLRKETRYENGQLSPQLKRLIEAGWIDKVKGFKTKGDAYQITERFFNIWFLMRRSSRRQKRELYCLSKFLESFYGDAIGAVALNSLQSKFIGEKHLTYTLALADAAKDKDLKLDLNIKSINDLKQLEVENPEICIHFSKQQILDKLNLWEVFDKIKHLINESDFTSAEKLLDLLNEEMIHNDFESAFFIGYYYHEIGSYLKAEQAYHKAIELDEKLVYSWYNLGILYQEYLNNYSKAERAYLKAIELDEKFIPAWNNLGNIYQDYLKKYPEAERAYLKAIELDEKYAQPWNGLGNLYQDHFKKYSEAEKAYKTAIDLDENELYAKFNLVFLYRDKMNRVEEAEILFNNLQIVQEIEDSYWLNKALFELYKGNKGIAAEFCEKALSLIHGELPLNTQDDWWRFGAVATKLGYGKWFTDILEEKGYDVVLSPYYVALRAMNEKDSTGYLNSKAVEIREPAQQILDLMKRFNE